jgi:hypothetical protein
MPKPAIDYNKYLTRIPTHSELLPAESSVPHRHYRRSANDAWNLLAYIERNFKRVNVYAASSEPHFRRLSTMVLLAIVEALERFLKEIAAECINHVAPCIVDDRLEVFTVRGNVISAHFAENNLGKALCESLTWCDCDETNKRMRRILADPFDAGNFYVFPSATQHPGTLRGRYELMSLVWQLRHTIAHNTGVITASDAQKFRLLVKGNVESPRLLWPTRGDVWYVKLFVDETVELINSEVAGRLSALLTTLHGADPSLFAVGEKAQALADLFGIPATVAGEMRQPA